MRGPVHDVISAAAVGDADATTRAGASERGLECFLGQGLGRYSRLDYCSIAAFRDME